MPDAMHIEALLAPAADPHGMGDIADFPSLTAEQERRLASMLNTHFVSVWRAGRRMGLHNAQAEENAQEVFAVAARKLTCIEPGRERAFLLGVAVRLASNARRKAALCVEPLEREAIDPMPLAEELLAQKQQRSVLDRVLLSMSDDLREVLTLYEIEELNLPEIAEALEIPAGTAASRLRRAREDFSRRIERFTARNARPKEKS